MSPGKMYLEFFVPFSTVPFFIQFCPSSDHFCKPEFQPLCPQCSGTLTECMTLSTHADSSQMLSGKSRPTVELPPMLSLLSGTAPHLVLSVLIAFQCLQTAYIFFPALIFFSKRVSSILATLLRLEMVVFPLPPQNSLILQFI